MTILWFLQVKASTERRQNITIMQTPRQWSISAKFRKEISQQMTDVKTKGR